MSSFEVCFVKNNFLKRRARRVERGIGGPGEMPAGSLLRLNCAAVGDDNKTLSGLRSHVLGHAKNVFPQVVENSTSRFSCNPHLAAV